jgi:hypothetical protein
MSTYSVNASTSVVLLDTSILTAGASAVVLLTSVSPPGRNVTIRDSLGYLSSPQSIIVSTVQNVYFADGTSSIQISQPFATLSFTSRDTSTWNIINTFGFPLYDTIANVNSITASTFTGTTLDVGGTISTSQIIGNSLYLTSSSQVLGPTFVSSIVVGSQSANIFQTTPGYSAYVMGSSYVTSNVSVGGNLTVAGLGDFQSSINVGTTLNVGAGLSVGGNMLVQGNFQTLANGLIECGSLAIRSSLTVLGPVIFNSNVGINSNLTVVGQTTLGSLYTSTMQINTAAGGFLQFDTGPTLRGRNDIIPGQVVASWTSPIYTPYLSTQTVQTIGFTNTSVLQVGSIISAPTVTQFVMGSTAITNGSGSLTTSSIAVNNLTLSNTFNTGNIFTSSLYVSSLTAQTLITAPTLSTAALYTSSLNAQTISTGSILANVIQTPAVSVSSLTVAQTIIGGTGFTLLSIPSTVIQNDSGSFITSSLYTTSLFTSTLSMTSGTLQTNSSLRIIAPSVYINALNVSSLTASTIQISTLNATQITIGSAPTSNLGPTLSLSSSTNVAITGGPGNYLTPYFLSNVIPSGQNPAVPYSPSASFVAQGLVVPGAVIGYTATLFWAGSSASYLTVGPTTLYGIYNSDQTTTGTLASSTLQIQGVLYGSSAINVTFSYTNSSNANSIDSNAVLEFNNGILKWNYALNGTTIQNSLNDISTRNLFYYGGLQFASDPRLKENVEDADLERCYNTIQSLPLRRYKYIDSYLETFQVKDTHRLGFLATDLLPHFPKSVHASDSVFPEFSTSLLTIDTSQVEMAHLGATKYLIQEVERLEALLLERL